MSLTRERIDNNNEKIIYNGKSASLSGTILIKDLSKKGWVIVDCSLDNKITKGMTNVANQLSVKLNIVNFYCKYDGSISLIEKQRYNIVAELYLSKETTLYGKITKLNPISSNLEDSISITNESKSPTSTKLIDKSSQNISEKIISLQNINLSDDTLNKLKLAIREAFSDVLKESTKNLSMLVDVIKELTVVIDKKDQQSLNIKSTPSKDKPSTTKNKKNIADNISFNKDDINVHFDEEDIPFDEEDFPIDEEDIPIDEKDNPNDLLDNLNEHKTNK
jgi:hypothetical protein